MGKFIIENRAEDLTDLEALDLVQRVIKRGRISKGGKQYCYATVFTVNEGPGKTSKYAVWTDLNKCSDRFVIQKEPS